MPTVKVVELVLILAAAYAVFQMYRCVRVMEKIGKDLEKLDTKEKSITK